MLRHLRTYLSPDARAEGLDGASLARLSRVVIQLAVVITNVVGAVVVVVLALLVIPLPDGGGVAPINYITAAAAYLLVAVPIGVIVGVRGQAALVKWLESGRPSNPQIRAGVLRAPLRLFWLQLWLWFGAAVAGSCALKYSTDVWPPCFP